MQRRLDGLLAGVVAALIQTFRAAWWRLLISKSNLLALCGVTGIALSTIYFGDQIAGFLPTVFGYPLVACSAAMVAGAALYWSVERPFLKLQECLAIAAPLR